MNERRSFTLLEIFVAVFLMSLILVAVVQGQVGSVNRVVRSEKMSQALALAEEKMTELEIELQRKNFESFPDEEKGEFDDEKLQEFTWIRYLEKVDIGCFVPQQQQQEDGAQTQPILGLFEQIFERAVRKVIVRIEWEEAGQTRGTELVQLYVRFEDMPDSL